MKPAISYAHKAIVTSVLGGEQGALSAVRSLGRMGVRVAILAESGNSPALRSKYAAERHRLNRFTTDEKGFVGFLMNYGRRQSKKPVIIPTADPDMILIDKHRDALSEYYLVAVPGENAVERFTYKRNFYEFAREHGLPIPETYYPADIEELRCIGRSIPYPAILKPSDPRSWNDDIHRIIGYKKVCIVNCLAELMDTSEKIYRHSSDIILQEFIPGDDASHFDLHVYCNGDGNLLASFVGRKIRIQPPYAGTGCFVRSVSVPELRELGEDLLKRIGFRGLANIDFKKDSRTGKFVLLEINPRLSQWSILATECGVNMPFIAYSDLVGMGTQKPSDQKENIVYVDFRRDVSAVLEYRKNGEMTISDWIKSLVNIKKVYQYYSLDDLQPFFVESMNIVKNKFFARR